jgi:hypothetical protein
MKVEWDTHSARRRKRRFPGRELARFLLAPLLATVIVIFAFVKPWRDGATLTRSDGRERVLLIRKSGTIRSGPLPFGGPSGSVWYTPEGPRLGIELRAKRLTPGKRYILELAVDSATIYDVASYQADSAGQIAVDTSLARFAEGLCVGDNYHPPRSLQGPHTIRFWLKLDGNPRTGMQRIADSTGALAAELPCTGNGDGDYRYVLLESAPAHFTGSE